MPSRKKQGDGIMKFIITGRKIEVTDGMKARIFSKLGKLDKFFSDEPEAKVTVSAVKDRHTVEVTIFDKGVMYRAEETDSDLYTAIDRIEDVIERQMRRHKTHLEKKLKKGAFDIPYEGTEPIEEKEINVIKRKKFAFKPMGVEEAVLQMELLGHTFFVFNNADDDGRIAIVYKRKDGNYGLIEQE